MRSIFSFCRIFSSCLFIFYFLPSCKTTSGVTGKSDEPKKRGIIRIVGSEKTGKLQMIDEKGDSAYTYKAWTGQEIKWKIADKSVKSFDSFPPKKDKNPYTSIFSKEPHKKFLSRTWKAKIADTKIEKLQDYFYNIYWMDKNGQHHRFDPVIQVSPKGR